MPHMRLFVYTHTLSNFQGKKITHSVILRYTIHRVEKALSNKQKKALTNQTWRAQRQISRLCSPSNESVDAGVPQIAILPTS